MLEYSYSLVSFSDICVRFSLSKRKQLMEEDIVALANLFPHTAEEARTLIPSLAVHLEDHDIQEILNDLKSYESKDAFETK